MGPCLDTRLALPDLSSPSLDTDSLQTGQKMKAIQQQVSAAGIMSCCNRVLATAALRSVVAARRVVLS